mmetsp:Transcript_29775/g.79134  ORF Transcript_29775/g.79134 Transcript_29775/m.79134 type:complete len:276 (-) Transcript_29775:385-1212(-)
MSFSTLATSTAEQCSVGLCLAVLSLISLLLIVVLSCSRRPSRTTRNVKEATGLELRVRHRSKRQRARALRVLQGTTQQGPDPCKVAVTREPVGGPVVATVDPQSQHIHEQEPVHAFPEPGRDTKGPCMPEQVADLGVDDFNCITTDTSDSASEEVEADIPAGEADVLAEPSESRDPASEMFYGRELLLAHRVLRKRISCGAPGLEQIVYPATAQLLPTTAQVLQPVRSEGIPDGCTVEHVSEVGFRQRPSLAGSRRQRLCPDQRPFQGRLQRHRR